MKDEGLAHCKINTWNLTNETIKRAKEEYNVWASTNAYSGKKLNNDPGRSRRRMELTSRGKHSLKPRFIMVRALQSIPPTGLSAALLTQPARALETRTSTYFTLFHFFR